jgi:hypothetical protein
MIVQGGAWIVPSIQFANGKIDQPPMAPMESMSMGAPPSKDSSQDAPPLPQPSSMPEDTNCSSVTTTSEHFE